jgi:hypothetical protein
MGSGRIAFQGAVELVGANGSRCLGRFGDQDLNPGRRNGRPGGRDYHRSRWFRDLRHADGDEPVGGGRPRAGDQRRGVPDDSVDGEGPQITAESVGVGRGARREQLFEACTDGASCCLLAGANGAAWISAAEHVMQRIGLAYRSMYTSLQCGAGRC